MNGTCKRFNPIIDATPETVWESIVEKTDFKQVIKFFAMCEDNMLNENEKYYCLLNLFFNTVPDLPPIEIINAVKNFISYGESDDAPKQTKKIFDWNADADRIFASFWQVYKIDLRKENMHWFTFKSLFQNLPESSPLMQVVALRARKPGKNDSAEAKAELRKAQRAVRIEDDVDPLDALAGAFEAWGK